MDLLPQGQIKVFFLLWRRLLSAYKTLISLLSRTYRSCITSSCDILYSDHLLLHWILNLHFSIVTRSRRHSACDSFILNIFFTCCRADAVDLALHALLHLDVLQARLAFHSLDGDVLAPRRISRNLLSR